jgi:SET domain-containing protein
MPPSEPELQTEWIVFRASPIHGTGGFARIDIPVGARLLEYVGEKIDKAESLRRCEADNPFIFALNDHQDLDGNVSWNPARLLNHSCTPNCDAENHDGRIWIIARRDIAAGEEITFNYGFDLTDYQEYPCHCGSADCVGYMVAEVFFPHVRRQRH